MGSHVDSVAWLPDTASDISFRSKSGFGSFRFAVFTISKEGIQAFAEENELSLKSEKDVSLGFMGYILEENQMGYIIKDALVGHDLDPDSAAGTTIAYDIQAHRAYYAFSAF